ncbi:MAG: 3-deoxy-7-phosphoheptulonate synthase [Ectothiorhodospiraceae bacterium]|nr:3-deoxy-7-phosphoheptulonate synthase [Chromatiales bacterium]MCP5153480.1 3-deoxy-7-phosphoheptulonate synthase [Ectothiorhodospiraceae bacterium]
MYKTEDLRIQSIEDVITPSALHEEYPVSDAASKTVYEAREGIHRLLTGEDDRLLVIVGPCSIHDPKAAREYAGRLAELRQRLSRELLVVMRVYFEKPRTTVGWKGLINDPGLDESYDINRGLRLGRELLLDLNHSGMPAGVEFLDVVTPQYLTDLVSWGAIGARTTESQIHRELASGLSCPVGFKNGTDGNLKIAVDAVGAARHPHCFLSYTQAAHSAIFRTTGNADTHIILRGGREPNYDAASVQQAADMLRAAGLEERVMVDFSHANSRKKPELQVEVCKDVADRIAAGEARIMGVMIESHLVAGRQDVKPGQPLVYGKSITDGCVGWDETVGMLESLARAVAARRDAAGGRRATGA